MLKTSKGRKIFEICRKLNLSVERRLTKWDKPGIRLKCEEIDKGRQGKGAHFVPFKEFWYRRYVVKRIDEALRQLQEYKELIVKHAIKEVTKD